MRTQFENAVLDLFEDNRITLEGAKTVLWTLLTAIYEDELIEEPHRRETVIENIERQKERATYQYFGSEVREMSAHFNISLNTKTYLPLCIIAILFVGLAVGPTLSIAKATNEGSYMNGYWQGSLTGPQNAPGSNWNPEFDD